MLGLSDWKCGKERQRAASDAVSGNQDPVPVSGNQDPICENWSEIWKGDDQLQH